MVMISNEDFDAELSLVFGCESTGNTINQRAKSSTREFIRGQDELSPYEGKGRGRVLTAIEALEVYGYECLKEAAIAGSVILSVNHQEPSRTIRERRTSLGLSLDDMGSIAGLSKQDIEKAEDPNCRTPFSILQRIAQFLALNELQLSVVESAGGDQQLATRLRIIGLTEQRLSSRSVLALSEAAWVINKEYELSRKLKLPVYDPSSLGFTPSENYGAPGYPAWMQGFWLANQTRKLLSIGPTEPIKSLREICLKSLHIPVIQTKFTRTLAGAAIASQGARGIVVNTQGDNENVWIRRMTIAHELGHLLWDPDQRLQELQVDEYSSLDRDVASAEQDAAEQRANAFAIEFLAPQEGIRQLVGDQDPRQIIREIMIHFGIGFTAAKFHCWNTFDKMYPLDSFTVDNTKPTDEWVGTESFTADYFSPHAVPISRRGYVSWLTYEALRNKLISNSTAKANIAIHEEDDYTTYLEFISSNKDLFG